MASKTGNFDFAKALAYGREELTNNRLFAVVLGGSTAGKSSVCGTFAGKTLFLHTSGEDHGPSSAAARSDGNIFPICFDRNFTGEKLSADESWINLLNILGDFDSIKDGGFEAVVVDGLTEVEALIRSTSLWAKGCLTDKGLHNNWQESSASLAMFRLLLNALKTLQFKTGVDVVCTCLTDVQELGEDGQVISCKPILQSLQVVQLLMPQFGDRLLVGPVRIDGEKKYAFQFEASISRVSKDLKTQVVKKFFNFGPRVLLGPKAVENGVEVPDLLPANFAYFKEFKNKSY